MAQTHVDYRSYQLTRKWVWRGGWGRYYTNPSNDYLQTAGFSISTPYVYTLDGNRTFLPNLMANPYPDGILKPPGAGLGALSYIGRGFSFYNRDFKVPNVDQFSLGIQYELPWRSRLEVSYVGSRGHSLQGSRSYNDYPAELRDSCSYFYGGNPAICDERLPYNPFYGLAPWEGTGTYSSTTTTRAAMARPFPHFGGHTMLGINAGRTWYNSAQLIYEIRGRGGLNLNVSYTFSKHMEQTGWLDSVTGVPQQSLYSADRPHRLVVSNVWQLPFGKGRRWANTSHRLWNRLVSGWDSTVIFQIQSGRPADLPGGLYLKEDLLKDIDWNRPRVRGRNACILRWNENNTITPQPFSVAAGCTEYNWLILPRYTSRLIPTRDGRLRLHSVPQIDLSFNKTTRISERFRVQFRAEAFNVTNTYYMNTAGFSTDLESPNFGTLVPGSIGYGAANFPRHVQLAAKLLW